MAKNDDDQEEKKGDIGSLLGLIAVFIVGFAMIAMILWPLLSPPSQ